MTSSRAVILRADGVSASVHPDEGGRLGQVTVGERPLLRGHEAAHLGWGHWGAYPLLPWSNRIPEGRFTHRGRPLQVPVNWEDGSALHGLVAWVPWTVTTETDTEMTEIVEVDVGAYHVRGEQRLRLTSQDLTLSLSVTNLGPDPVPAGLGIHPWFHAGPIRVPAGLRWPGEGPLPDGPPRPVQADEDLRTIRVPPSMDRCYTGLTETGVDVPGCRLEWTGPVTQVVVYSEQPEWVCVEPVTMANDGFGLAAAGVAGTGVLDLDPGESAAVEYRFSW